MAIVGAKGRDGEGEASAEAKRGRRSTAGLSSLWVGWRMDHCNLKSRVAGPNVIPFRASQSPGPAWSSAALLELPLFTVFPWNGIVSPGHGLSLIRYTLLCLGSIFSPQMPSVLRSFVSRRCLLVMFEEDCIGNYYSAY